MPRKPKPAEYWRPLDADEIDEINREALGSQPLEPTNPDTNAALIDRLLVEFDRRLSHKLEPFILNWGTRFPVGHFVFALAPYVSEVGVPYKGSDVSPEQGEWLYARLQAALGNEHASLSDVVKLLKAQGYGLHPALDSHAAWAEQHPSQPNPPNNVETSTDGAPSRAKGTRPNAAAAEWRRLEIIFRDDKTVTIRRGGEKIEDVSFDGMGFRSRNGGPTKSWEYLAKMAQYDGWLPFKPKYGETVKDSAVAKQIREANKRLRKYFGIGGTPIYFRTEHPDEYDSNSEKEGWKNIYSEDRGPGWKTAFKLRFEARGGKPSHPRGKM